MCPKKCPNQALWTPFGKKCPIHVQNVSNRAACVQEVSILQAYLDIFWTLCAKMCPIQNFCVHNMSKKLDTLWTLKTKSLLKKMCSNLCPKCVLTMDKFWTHLSFCHNFQVGPPYYRSILAHYISVIWPTDRRPNRL